MFIFSLRQRSKECSEPQLSVPTPTEFPVLYVAMNESRCRELAVEKSGDQGYGSFCLQASFKTQEKETGVQDLRR